MLGLKSSIFVLKGINLSPSSYPPSQLFGFLEFKQHIRKIRYYIILKLTLANILSYKRGGGGGGGGGTVVSTQPSIWLRSSYSIKICTMLHIYISSYICMPIMCVCVCVCGEWGLSELNTSCSFLHEAVVLFPFICLFFKKSCPTMT